MKRSLVIICLGTVFFCLAGVSLLVWSGMYSVELIPSLGCMLLLLVIALNSLGAFDDEKTKTAEDPRDTTSDESGSM